MVLILETALTVFALWGQVLFPALIVASVAAIVLLGRGHRWFLAPTWKGRIATLLTLPVIAFSLFFLFALPEDLTQFLDGIRRLHATIGHEADDVGFRFVADDAATSLHGVRNGVTLVNLWATWCPPCIAELPDLDKLQNTYRDQGLVVVTLSQEERERLLAFAAKNDYGMTNVYAEKIGWLDVGPSRPVTVVIDGEGIVRDIVIGGRDYEGFEKMVGPLLGGA